jgi:hypothetical protein
MAHECLAGSKFIFLKQQCSVLRFRCRPRTVHLRSAALQTASEAPADALLLSEGGKRFIGPVKVSIIEGRAD